MSLVRWLSVALVTLSASSSLVAQNTPFSVLGLTTLFGQGPVESNSGALPWAPVSPGSILGFTYSYSEEAEELPAPRRCDTPDCMSMWKEQWDRGNFREAEMLAMIACRLDPTSVTAQHARAVSELMQRLIACQAHYGYSPEQEARRSFIQAMMGLEDDSPLVAARGVNSARTRSCAEESAYYEEADAPCQCPAPKAAAKVAAACACAAKPECCCAKQVRETSACACAPRAAACCCSPKAVVKSEAACACCTCATPDKKARAVLSPFAGNRDFTLHGCPVMDELRVLLSAPRSASAPVMAVVPPVYVPAPHPMPPSAMLPPPPTPIQVYRDLDCARTASMQQQGWQAVQSTTPTRGRQSVHLITPQFEARCERLSSAGNPDQIVLEGDVQVTCTRHGQVMRIEGQRVLVNLASGSFSVEGANSVRQATMVPRVAAPVPPTAWQAMPATHVAPTAPMRAVRPMSYVPEYEPYKPE